MQFSDDLRCEQCGSKAPVVIITGHVLGRRKQWPKTVTVGNALHVFIDCPKCGEHLQAIENARGVCSQRVAKQFS
jgi:hypothetical protein